MVTLALLLGAAAHAKPATVEDDDVLQARRHYQRGLAHFNLQEYVEASPEFKEAYRLHPDPFILYNLAQSERLSHEPEAAIAAYRAFLRSAPNAPNRGEVASRIAELETAIRATKTATAAKPTEIAPPEVPRTAIVEPAKPSAPRVEAEPTAHVPLVLAPTRVVELAPAAVIAPNEPPPRRRSRGLIAGLVIGSIVVVGLAVGLGAGLGGSSTSYPSANHVVVAQ